MNYQDFIRESDQRQKRLARAAGHERGCELNFNFLKEIYGGICSCIRSCIEGRSWC